MKNRYKNLAKNTLWVSIGTFGSKTISFILLPIFTRVLSKDSYGKIDFFTITIELLMMLLSVDIASAVFRFLAEKSTDDNNNRKILSTSYLSIVFISLLLTALSPLIFKVNSIFIEMRYYMFFSIVLGLIISINRNYLRATEKMSIFALSDIINTLGFAIFGIVFVAVYQKGVEGYLQAYLFAQIITGVYVFLAGKIYNFISIRAISLKMLKQMVKYTAPLIPNNLSWWIMNVSDKYLIIYFLGFSLSGIYAISYKFMALITMLNHIFYRAWQVSAVKEHKNSDKDLFYSNVFYYLSSTLISLLLIFSIIMKPFVKIMVGNRFENAWIYLPFLLLGALFSSFSSFYGTGYITSKETKGAFTTSVYGALVNLIINLIFIPVIGLQAAALSTMCAFFVMWIFRLKQTKKYFKIDVDYRILFLNISVLSISLFANFLDIYHYYIQSIMLTLFVLFNMKYFKNILEIIKKSIFKLRNRLNY